MPAKFLLKMPVALLPCVELKHRRTGVVILVGLAVGIEKVERPLSFKYELDLSRVHKLTANLSILLNVEEGDAVFSFDKF